ncbi:HsdR family type I site-specific deoxyribonuclease [Granulosicoccus sp.]|nr:HsdR family type I site-specific deoxyribonuclease [Granulosicoccus sp.]
MRPETKEEYSSKIPALVTLINLGWEYMPPSDVKCLRASESSVVLRQLMIKALSSRTFDIRGNHQSLSAGAIEQLVAEFAAPALNEGLMTANHRLYDKLYLGITVAEFVDGKRVNVTVPLLDWDRPENNLFHVTEEFPVLNAAGTSKRMPDIVCFVNGIPLVVIEAKRPDSGNANKDMVEEGVSQNLRNQKPDEIQPLFAYAQLLMAINGIKGKYGTTRTPAKFWALWREEEFTDTECSDIKNFPLADATRQALFKDRNPKILEYFEQLWLVGGLAVTDQDKLLIGLLTPHRLLDFIRFYLLFDNRVGKIAARYPQRFGTEKLVKRIETKRRDGGRDGGVIWHTTGSGKSFTMVFLCRALLLVPSLKNCQLIVVTDRVDLERQLAKTFSAGGAFGHSALSAKEGEKAIVTTGTELAKRIGAGKERILFTMIQKFTVATKLPECFNDSADLIVLIDEGHRSQSGENHERMRNALPNAAFVAFTGTPLLKHEKTVNKFGPILHAYTMRRAVEDGAVTPLLYEERQPELAVNDKAIDAWFDRITDGLSSEQQADLKKQYSRRQQIYGSDNRIELIAWDIAAHFRSNFASQNVGLKGQIATDKKLSAIRYHEHLKRTGLVTSAVIISSPDTREGHANADESSTPEVQRWWQENVTSSAEEYEKRILSQFASEGTPDLLIVVDKLLTGFDEPRNTVLYIDKPLRDHNLIQAIARVNRLHDQKRFGYLIDYRGILEELDTSIKKYQDLADHTQNGYDIDDIYELYRSTEVEYRQMPSLHSSLWGLFSAVRNRSDLEQYRQVLMPRTASDNEGDEFDPNLEVREDFYEALTAFGMCLKLALASSGFYRDSKFSETDIMTWKDDLKWFTDLRKIARQDAEETVDYSAYEDQIRRLVDTHVVGSQVAESAGVYQVDRLGQDELENWSDEKARNEADLIRTRVRKSIEHSLDDDPYAKKVFSKLLREAIEEAEVLFDHPVKQYALFHAFEQQVKERDHEYIPNELRGSGGPAICYGILPLVLGEDEFQAIANTAQEDLIELARSMDATVSTAMAEHSLNPAAREAAISKGLLPTLFKRFGMEAARTMISKLLQATRASRASW